VDLGVLTSEDILPFHDASMNKKKLKRNEFPNESPGEK